MRDMAGALHLMAQCAQRVLGVAQTVNERLETMDRLRGARLKAPKQIQTLYSIMNFINTYLKLPIINYSIISEEKPLFSEKKSFVAEKKGESWRIRIFQNKN